MSASLTGKLIADTGGGCSICGDTPVVNVHGAYWLCGPCVLERLEELDRLRTALQELAKGEENLAPRAGYMGDINGPGCDPDTP